MPTAQNPAALLDRWFWGAPAVVLAVLLYCVGFAALRLGLTATIGVDDAREIVAAQTLRLGYLPQQPPLYTWWFGAVGQFTGNGLLAVVVAKYTLLLATFWLYFRAAARLAGPGWPAALATLSLILLYLIGYKVHRGFTHTIALIVLVPLTLETFLILARSPTTRGYALFGVVLGLGLLSKYNFVFALLAILGAGLLDPSRRPAVLDRRMALAALIAAAIVAPFGAWLAADWATFASLAERYALAENQADPWFSRLLAVGAAASAVFEFLFPFVLIVPVVFWTRRAGGALRAAWSDPDAGFALRLVLVGLGLLFASALLAGTGFKGRYLHPFLLFTPIALFATLRAGLDAGALSAAWLTRRIRVYCGLAGVLVMVAIAGLFGWALTPPPHCGKCKIQRPYPDLARTIGDRHPGPLTVIAGDEFIAANLIAHRPSTRAYVVAPIALGPAALDRSPAGCVLIWDLTDGAALPPALQRAARNIRGAPVPPDAAARTLALPFAMAPDRTHAWRVLEVPATGDCG